MNKDSINFSNRIKTLSRKQPTPRIGSFPKNLTDSFVSLYQPSYGSGEFDSSTLEISTNGRRHKSKKLPFDDPDSTKHLIAIASERTQKQRIEFLEYQKVLASQRRAGVAITASCAALLIIGSVLFVQTNRSTTESQFGAAKNWVLTYLRTH